MNKIEPLKRRGLSDDAKERLRAHILDGDMSEPRKLPSEADLAKQLSVSRVTIRRSLSELEQEGLILRLHGRGTFVNPVAANVKVNLGLMMEFGTVIERNGYHADYELTYCGHEAASLDIARELKTAPGSRLIRVDKLHSADAEPVIASLGRIPADLFETEPPAEVWAKNLNFDVLQRYAGHIVVRDWVEVKAVTLAQAEAVLDRSLPMAAQSLLMMRAVGYDQGNLPVIHGVAFYDTDRLQISLLRNASDELS